LLTIMNTRSTLTLMVVAFSVSIARCCRENEVLSLVKHVVREEKSDLISDSVVLHTFAFNDDDEQLHSWHSFNRNSLRNRVFTSTSNSSVSVDMRTLVVSFEELKIPKELLTTMKWLTPKVTMDKEDLRLDSLTFQYECLTEGVTLSEVYSIPTLKETFSQKIAHLSEETRFTWIHSPNTWKRRKDLRGAKLINAFLPFDKYVRNERSGDSDSEIATRETNDFEGVNVDVTRYFEEVHNFTSKWVSKTFAIIIFVQGRSACFNKHVAAKKRIRLLCSE